MYKRQGTSWGKLAQNVEGTLLQFAKNESLLAGSFDAIATVLGTNDIVKKRGRPELWVKLSEHIRVVLEGTKKYLRPGCPATAILVTSPFHVEPDSDVKQFGDIMQEVCKAVGVSFIPVQWKKIHKSTRTPAKRFTTAGVALLTDAIVMAYQQVPKSASSTCLLYTSPSPRD